MEVDKIMGGPLVSPGEFINGANKALSRVERGKRLIVHTKPRLIQGNEVLRMANNLINFRENLPEGPRESVGDILNNKELLKNCSPVGVVIENLRSEETNIEAFFLGAPYAKVETFLGLKTNLIPTIGNKKEIFYISDMFIEEAWRGQIGHFFRETLYELLKNNYNWILFASTGKFLDVLSKRYKAESYGTDKDKHDFFLLPIYKLEPESQNVTLENFGEFISNLWAKYTDYL